MPFYIRHNSFQIPFLPRARLASSQLEALFDSRMSTKKIKVRRELPSELGAISSRLSNQDHAFQRNNLSRHTTQRQELNTNGFKTIPKARTLPPLNRALQAEFYDAIFGPESRVTWLIRDEGTVTALLRNH